MEAGEPLRKRGRTTPQQSQQSESPDPLHTANDYGSASFSVVRDAVVYLKRLAADTEKSAVEATAQVNDGLGKLKAEMVALVDKRIGLLKENIQSNLASSFNRLKTLNTNDYSGNQRLIIPSERLLSALGSSLNDIYILVGTHILDLPVPVLSQIVGYLPAKSVLNVRSVCLQFRDVVSKVYGCDGCTFSAKAIKDGDSWWIAEGDIISTPCMDFELEVRTKKPAGTLQVRLLLSKKKLYAHDKTVSIQVTANKKTTKTKTLHLSLSGLCEMNDCDAAKGQRFTFDKAAPTTLAIKVHINDVLY
ncbi:hypothetical protein Pelo_6493 [Pelomyxa schiedti]|nr:hypothetical protein Pelo_6493 [Pelomyxa schiedti]